MKTKAQYVEEGFNPYAIIKHLQTADLIIHTIPDEEWTLSCSRHKTLLVDVYTLVGILANKRRVTFRCGRLTEVLLKVMANKRRVQYINFTPRDENMISFARTNEMLAPTLEEDFLIRLRGGDLLFHIQDKRWRLTNTWFGQTLAHSALGLFRLADEDTLGTEKACIYSSIELHHVLLEFLCQDSMFVEHREQSNVLEFRGIGKASASGLEQNN